MADGGSINLRLSLKGAEQVRGELDKIGPAGAKMGRELDRAMRAPGPGLQALDTGVRSARGELEGFAGRLGPVGAGMAGLGAAGLAVAAGVTAAVLAAAAAVQQSVAAMRFADDLEDAAGKINIGVEALQEWRFAAAQAGATAADADSAIDSFQKKLGEAMAGGRSLKWFSKLGLDPKDFDSTEAALDAVIDKIAGLASEAERAALADKLGLSPLIPLVRLGAEAIEDMRAQARDLGIVMDEAMVKRGAEASREMEILAQQIDMQLKQAFIDLAPVILETLRFVGWLAEGLRDVAEMWKELDKRSTAGLRDEYQRHAAAVHRMMSRDGVTSPDDLNPMARRQFDQSQARMGEIAGVLAARASDRSTPRSPVPATTLRDTPSSSGGSSAARDAERRRREGERALADLGREELAAERAVLRARFGPGGSEEARAELALATVTIETEALAAKREALRKQLQDAGVLDSVIEARLEELRIAQGQAARLEDQAILREEAADRAEAMRAAEDAHLEITTEILSLASSTARTSGERRAIELSLLEIAQRRQRADLEAAIEAEKEPAARARLIEALARLPALFEAQARAVDRQNANPVRRWQEAQIQSGGEAGEWLQGAALDALDGVNAGLREAWRNADSAGDAFKRMGDVAVDALGRVVDALLEVALQRMFIEPMIAALFGDGKSGGGGGGLLGSFLNNFAGSLFGGGGSGPKPPSSRVTVTGSKGFGRGGLNGAAGRYPVGEYGMEVVDLPVGARIYDTDRTERTLLDFDNRMRARGEGGGASPTINLTARVINQTSEPVQAKVTKTPQGIDVLLEPAVRAGVARMGADGSLARANAMAPKPIKR